MNTPDTPGRTPAKPGTVSIIPRLRLHAGLPLLSSWLPVVRPQPADGEERAPAKP
jgi:hypothetical protein